MWPWWIGGGHPEKDVARKEMIKARKLPIARIINEVRYRPITLVVRDGGKGEEMEGAKVVEPVVIPKTEGRAIPYMPCYVDSRGLPS